MVFSEELKRMPMLRLLLPLILGIIIQDKMQFSLSSTILAGGLLFILLFLSWVFDRISGNYNYRWIYGLLLNCFLLLLSLILMGSKAHKSSFMDHSFRGGYYLARVSEIPQEREKRFRVMVEPFVLFVNNSTISTSGKALVWLEKDSHAGGLKPGDRLVIPNSFNELANQGNPYEFDYRRFLMLQGVCGESYLSGDLWFLAETNAGKSIHGMSGELREKLLGVLEKYKISGKEYSVAGALLLGNRSGLDSDIRHSYAVSGAMHILAVSGLHVGILYLFLTWILRFLRHGRYTLPLRLIITLLVIWMYASVTGLSPSVTRAATMFSFVAMGRFIGRRASIYNTLASSAMIHLLANPYLLYMVGFQLSYIAVAGIAYFQPLFCSVARFRNPAAAKLWSLTTVSFSAQLAIFPLILYYFNQFPNYFLVTNIFAIPLAMIILYSGLLLFTFSVIPVMSSVFAVILNLALISLNFLTEWISTLPFSYVSDIVISMPVLIILYGIILLISSFAKMRKPVFLIFAMLLAVTGLTLGAGNKIKTAGQKVFIIYNSGGYPLYNFISGRDNIIISGTDEEIRSGTVPYAAINPSMNLKTRNPNMVSTGEFFNHRRDDDFCFMQKYGRFVDFAGYSILFAPGYEHVCTVKPDYIDLVVFSAGSTPLPEILKSVVPELVVFDSSVPYSSRMEMTSYCIEKGIKFHDVRVSGALIVSMK
jgi:competence protein ComEC